MSDFTDSLPDEKPPGPPPRLWDPEPHDRQYFRHRRTGDLGWLVRREGKQHIKYDRPGQDLVRPYKKAEWIPEEEHRPLNEAQIVQVAFEADKKLCMYLGLHEKARQEWPSLSEQHRIAWMDEGPSDPPIRAALYSSIMGTLRNHKG